MSIIPRVDIRDLINNEINLKEALYYHICDPIERWKVKRVVPYKFILQIIKTVLILLQVCIYIKRHIINGRRLGDIIYIFVAK